MRARSASSWSLLTIVSLIWQQMSHIVSYDEAQLRVKSVHIQTWANYNASPCMPAVTHGLFAVSVFKEVLYRIDITKSTAGSSWEIFALQCVSCLYWQGTSCRNMPAKKTHGWPKFARTTSVAAPEEPPGIQGSRARHETFTHRTSSAVT